MLPAWEAEDWPGPPGVVCLKGRSKLGCGCDLQRQEDWPEPSTMPDPEGQLGHLPHSAPRNCPGPRVLEGLEDWPDHPHRLTAESQLGPLDLQAKEDWPGPQLDLTILELLSNQPATQVCTEGEKGSGPGNSADS